MRVTAIVLGTFASTVVAPLAAHAEDVLRVEATGEAMEGEKSARTHAIDDAFARAIEQVLSAELTRTQRRQHAKTLRQRVLRRARLFVVSFVVEGQTSIEGRLRVSIVAQIDREKLRRSLVDLGVDEGVGPGPGGGSVGTRPSIALLLHATLGGTTRTTFGEKGGDGGPAGRAFARELGELGFDLASAAGAAAPVSRGSGAGLPMDDAAAAALARKLGAGGVCVVGVEVRPAGTIRGTRLVGAEATSRVRVLDGSGKFVARAEARGVGYGETADIAAAEAARDAGEKAMGAVGPAATRYWPAPRLGGDPMVVRVKGAATWAMIDAIARQLDASRGVTSVTVRRIRRGEVVLAVETTMKTREIVGIVRTARVDGGSIVAKNRGQGRVEAVVHLDGGRE